MFPNIRHFSAYLMAVKQAGLNPPLWLCLEYLGGNFTGNDARMFYQILNNTEGF